MAVGSRPSVAVCRTESRLKYSQLCHSSSGWTALATDQDGSPAGAAPRPLCLGPGGCGGEEPLVHPLVQFQREVEEPLGCREQERSREGDELLVNYKVIKDGPVVIQCSTLIPGVPCRRLRV